MIQRDSVIWIRDQSQSNDQTTFQTPIHPRIESGHRIRCKDQDQNCQALL